jgi:benzoyl-CoA reductase/2-hydroxyglutaryl-CoA dehydratase subunit BcrC/BadD/HgdB
MEIPQGQMFEGMMSRAVKTTETAKKVRALTKKISQDAHAAAAEGRPIAYCFIISQYDEIIRTMGITPIWTESYAAITTIKRQSERFISAAQEEGFPRNLCTYCTIQEGFDAMRRDEGGIPLDSPDGGMEKPSMMLGTGMMICDARYKSYQVAQRFNEVPVYITDLQWPPIEADVKGVEDYYVEHTVEELRGLVEFLERQTGKKMDWEELDERIALANKTSKVWWEAYQLRKAVPAPMPTEDAMSTMVPGHFWMGTQEALDFYQELYDEIKYRVDNKIGTIPDEKYRLGWALGLPPWFALVMFNYFESKGAVFPIELTYHPHKSVEIPSSAKHPLEKIAWRFYRQFTRRHEEARNRSGDMQVEWLLELIEDYKLDAVVAHRATTCRTVHAGQIHVLNVLKDRVDIPTLILESDICDIMAFDEARIRGEIDAFIEVLEESKKRNN